jgi:hypothetical protein
MFVRISLQLLNQMTDFHEILYEYYATGRIVVLNSYNYN